MRAAASGPPERGLTAAASPVTVLNPVRCACDDCSLSHILTCGIVDPPVAGDLHIHQLPLQVDSAPDCLPEMRPPSVSSASSGSGSSSPVTIQQHPRLLLTDNSSAPAL